MTQKFLDIYNDLKNKIENGVYPKESFLPSEAQLMDSYHCTRYSTREALKQLNANGYVQSIHGKGVQVIFSPNQTSKFTIGGIESFREFATRNNMTYHTMVKVFAEIIVDEQISALTSFKEGEEAYYIQRIRYINGKPLIIDNNYFRKQYIPNLTKQIAEQSVFSYLENVLDLKIANIQRSISIEKATSEITNILQLDDLNCIFKITSNTYSDKGQLFEYTESIHHPDYFIFTDQINTRIK